METENLRESIVAAAPQLHAQLGERAKRWTTPIRERLDRRKLGRGFPKTFNDPIWGVITLYPWETVILDSPLLQRLRGVRQLGMAHHVYPGAGHDRLEHSRGVVEASERMIRALERNAHFRRRFGVDKDEEIPAPTDLDVVATRLAALLHDIGHGSFSHATEYFIRTRLAEEFDRASEVLREAFEGTTKIEPAELIAVLLVISEPMQAVLEHPRLEATSAAARLPMAISARILGSRSFLDATYLSGVISGPLDADKLDYMARDSHHAGLPLGLDINRLISKLEVVTVTPENAPNPELRARAERSPNKRFYEIGISLSGLGAYEQMIIGRVILYDRLYYHHKVRSAEAMVRRLFALAEEERKQPFALGEIFYEAPDDTTLAILGGSLKVEGLDGGKSRCRALADAIQDRQVYYRAFAFAPRFIAGLGGLSDQERRNTKALLWAPVLSELSTVEGCVAIAEEIHAVAASLAGELPDLKAEEELLPEHVVVDLPVNRAVVRGGDILTRTEDGHVATPNLFFDPERWSQAYEHQKQCGFVFTPRRFVGLVATAARIVFYEKYQLVMDATADRASKTAGEVKPVWFDEAAKRGICSKECAETFLIEKPRLVPVRENDLKPVFPDSWLDDDPELINRLAVEFCGAIPAGLSAGTHTVLLAAIGHLVSFVDAMAKGGNLVKRESLDEKREFQPLVRDHLRGRGADVIEGAEVGGGETDLLLSQRLVIENKVIGETAAPLEEGDKFGWQARRYSIPISSRVVVVVIAYRPKDEKAVLPLTKSVCVRPVEDENQEFCEVRFVIPWGQSVPSRAKAPQTP